jgi:hypothetical protein
MDKPHVLALATETEILQFKDEGPENFKRISGQTGKRYLSIGTTFASPWFRWTIHLTVKKFVGSRQSTFVK